MFKPFLLFIALFMAGATTAFAQQKRETLPDNNRQITFEMLVNQYHFPVKKNTGNPDRDQQVYAEAKTKWIAANQELYRRYNQQAIKINHAPRRATQPTFTPSK